MKFVELFISSNWWFAGWVILISCSSSKYEQHFSGTAKIQFQVEDTYLDQELTIRTFAKDIPIEYDSVHTIKFDNSKSRMVDVDYGGMQVFSILISPGDSLILSFEAGRFYNFGEDLQCEGSVKACSFIPFSLEIGSINARMQKIDDKSSVFDKYSLGNLFHANVDSLSGIYDDDELLILHNYIDKCIGVSMYKNFTSGVNDDEYKVIESQFDKAIAGSINTLLHIDKSFWPINYIVRREYVEGRALDRNTIFKRLDSFEVKSSESLVEALSILDIRMKNSGKTHNNGELLYGVEKYFMVENPSLFEFYREKYNSLPIHDDLGRFAMEDLKGNISTLKTIEGKLLYLDYWTTWCAPCIAEHQDWNRLYSIYDKDDVRFVSISLDSDTPKWREYVERNKLNGRNFTVPEGFNSELARVFNIKSVPRYVLLDSELRIISDDFFRPSDPLVMFTIDSLLRL